MITSPRVAQLFAVLLLALAAIASFTTSANAALPRGCYGQWTDACDRLLASQERMHRPPSNTCIHLPFTRAKAGPIEVFVLPFEFRVPPRWMSKEQAREYILEQVQQATFSDAKRAGPADDFCLGPAKLEGAMSVVFCDLEGFGYLRRDTLAYTLVHRWPPNGIRVPLHGFHYPSRAEALPVAAPHAAVYGVAQPPAYPTPQQVPAAPAPYPYYYYPAQPGYGYPCLQATRAVQC